MYPTKKKYYEVWRGKTYLSRHNGTVEAMESIFANWYNHAVSHNNHPAGWHPHSKPITYQIKIGDEVLYEVPTADVTIFNLSGDEPGGTDVIVPIAGAQANALASAVTAGQPSTSVNVNLTGAEAGARPGAVFAGGTSPNPGDTQWAPGHYVSPVGNPFKKTAAEHNAAILTGINGDAQSADFWQGILAPIPWGDIEPTAGQWYWNTLDGWVDACESYGQRLCLMVMHKSFTSTSVTVQAPQDLIDAGYIDQFGGNSTGHQAMLWYPEVETRYKEMMTQIANRYDGRVAFEWIMTQETAASQPNDPGYSNNNLGDAWKAIYEHMAVVFERSNACGQINSLSRNLTKLHEAVYNSGMAAGNPDARTKTIGWQFFAGDFVANEQPPRDYRYQCGRGMTVSASAYSGKGSPTSPEGYDPPRTAAELIPLMREQAVTHAFWTNQDFGGGKDFVDAIAAIEASPLLNTACPTAYSGCDTGGGPPPPTDPKITGITFDMTSVRNTAPGNLVEAEESDNWPITHAADGHQYTSFGDGKGFHNLGGGNNETRGSFGFSRIEGNANNYSAYDIFKSGEGMPGEQGKCYGILGASGKLYAAVDYFLVGGSGSRDDRYVGVSLISSTLANANAGNSWSEDLRWDSGDWGTGNNGFYSMAFLQFGQDHAKQTTAPSSAATDAYVYAYVMENTDGTYQVQTPGGISLMRCLEANLESGNKNHWSYLSNINASNQASWSTTITDRIPVFQDPSDGNDVSQVVYNSALERYVLVTMQGQREVPGAIFGCYDAPEPWGPWHTVVKQDATVIGPNLANSTAVITWGLSQKWTGAAGLDSVLVGTLQGKDQWGSVEIRFSYG